MHDGRTIGILNRRVMKISTKQQSKKDGNAEPTSSNVKGMIVPEKVVIEQKAP
jgi:hypothetical protein